MELTVHYHTIFVILFIGAYAPIGQEEEQEYVDSYRTDIRLKLKTHCAFWSKCINK